MKRLFALLLSFLMILSLCACQPSEEINPTETVVTTEPSGTEVTVPSTDATESTDPTWHLQEVADKLAGYATDFNWNDSVIEIILTVGLPDLDMFDHVEREDDTTFDIYLTDGTSYEVVLDAATGEVSSIHNNVATPTENDSYYKA